jgi:hypothetical protein
LTNNYCISNKLHTDFLLRLPGWEIAEITGIISDGPDVYDLDRVFIVVK